MLKYGLYYCDSLMGGSEVYTYYHESLNQRSFIDHFIISNDFPKSKVVCYARESGVNMSDHLAVVLEINNCSSVASVDDVNNYIKY
jgi:hypothetical protein